MNVRTFRREAGREWGMQVPNSDPISDTEKLLIYPVHVRMKTLVIINKSKNKSGRKARTEIYVPISNKSSRYYFYYFRALENISPV
jgi:hypothetical protein